MELEDGEGRFIEREMIGGEKWEDGGLGVETWKEGIGYKLGKEFDSSIAESTGDTSPSTHTV